MKPPTIILDFNRTLYDPQRRQLVPYARRVLRALRRRGYRIILISQARPGRAQRLRELDIDYYFDKLVFVRKKTQRVFSRLLPTRADDRKRCTVVGDRVREEIALGKIFGCKTIWVKQGKFSDEGPRNFGEMPDVTVPRLAAILAVME